MSVQWTPESAFAVEMRKWEMRPTTTCPDYTLLPRFNAPFQEFPKMLYQASRHDGGPRLSGTVIAESAGHEASLLHQGWSLSPDAAIAAITAQDQEFATLAAERHFVERGMSPRAQAEAQAADDATPAHLASLPVTPIRPHGAVVTTDFAIERQALHREIEALRAQVDAAPILKTAKPRRHKKSTQTPAASVEE